MGGDYSMLRGATGADYALFVVAREIEESGGRVLLGALSGIMTFPKRLAVACVADLLRKRMIWCHVEAYRGDLADPDDARAAIGKLFSDF